METDVQELKSSAFPPNITNAAIQLAVIKAKKSPLIEYLQKHAKKEADLEDVRNRLAKIKGSLAEEITENRAERL